MQKTQITYLIHCSKIHFKLLFFLTLFTSLTFHTIHSQKVSEAGLPYIQNYTPDLYQANIQNWDAVQDSLGVMYFANGNGILSYNGVDWNTLDMPNLATVFALTETEKGKIYAAGIDELGYLKSKINGELSYVSLLNKLPQEFHDFNQIRSVQATKDGVFFGSAKYLLKWDGKEFTSWENSGDPSIFHVNNKLYKRFNGKGLTVYKNGEFELVPQGHIFNTKNISAILPYDNDSLLIATENQLYIFNGSHFELFETNSSEFFTKNTVRRGITLNQESYAFGSSKKGILVIDKKGNKLEIFSKNRLLRSNAILNLFQDKSGLLWSLSNYGIAKIEYPSPFSFYNKNTNTPDAIMEFLRYGKTLYLGTTDGLYYLNDSNYIGSPQFQVVENDYGLTFDMIVAKKKMLVASRLGLFQIDSIGKSNRIGDFLSVLSLCASKINPNRVYIGSSSGLASMLYKNGEWQSEHVFNEIKMPVPKIFENDNGDLWLDIAKNEVVRVSFKNLRDAKDQRNPKVKIYYSEDGVPENLQKIYLIKNQLYVKAEDEAYIFNAETDSFSKDVELFKLLGFENKSVEINAVDDDGNVWLMEFIDNQRFEQHVAILKEDGGFDVKKLNEKRVIDIKKYGTYPELKDSVIWHRGRPGVVRHDLKNTNGKKKVHSKAIITKAIWNTDSLLFGGYTSSISAQLPYKNNQLRFQYANPSFYDESKNQFKYILEGFDQDWSTWTSETKKDYTNIPVGDYIFKVRSKNIFNDVSSEDSYSFSILPPWYLSWWAYLFYGIGAIALLSLLLQWRSKELRRKNENLEYLVAERTTEIRHKNELLNHQTEQLEQLNDSKTRLYSNITHEFRTPLTVILGMAETLKTNVLNKSLDGVDTSLEMIRRNGKNLLQLVNEMLDLAKVESGSMELNLVQTDAIPFVKYLSESFHSLAEAKQINLTVYSEINTLEMDIDVNKMASIISNLLSNAIKFTEVNGKIIVHLNEIKTKEGELFSIKVQDNGLGLAENDLTHLFDRFYQADNQSAQYQEGTGIGLSLAKEFAELMNGTISVESTLGKGSTFTVQIPVTNNADKTADAKITVEPPNKSSSPIVEKELSFEENSSELPLVLLIEDNVDVAHYLKTCLKGKYQTIHAFDGNAGLKMAYENIPDIIISDVMMPGKDGLEVCATLKADERTDHIPVILLTAKVTTEDRLTGLTHGADAYLAKPFNKEELFTRLDQLILVRKKLISKLEKNGLSSLLKEKVENPQTKFLKEVIESIHAHLDDANFGPTQLAKEMRFSESQIYRKLKSITDKSTAIFIRSVRLQKAKELIETTDKTISEIAYQVGFNDPSWFSRAFKKEFNLAPSDIHK